MNLPPRLPYGSKLTSVASAGAAFADERHYARQARRNGQHEAARFWARHARASWRHLVFLVSGENLPAHPTADRFE